MSLCRNIEVKFRIASWEAAEATARRVATEFLGRQHQEDTYFRCAHGRLKLREIDREHAELIWYERADVAAARHSDYARVPVPNGTALKTALGAALGIEKVVRKKREIFLYHNVRIHLDQVADLGDYAEFESVVSAQTNDAQARCRLDELLVKFGVSAEDFLSLSYADMTA